VNKKLPNLEGKIALITGASSGLGEKFAYLLAEQGCGLVLVARRQEKLEELKKALKEQYHIAVVTIVCDLALPAAAETLVDQLNFLGLKIDIFINNAGVGVGGAFTQNSVQDLKNMLNLNVVNQAILTNLIAKEMVQRKNGFILLVSSIGGEIITPQLLAYCGTKAFVTSLGVGLHAEVAAYNVHCTTLAPGSMMTGFFSRAGITRLALAQRVTALDPEKVALTGLIGLFANKSYVIPGWLNKLAVFTSRFLPHSWGPIITKKILERY